MRSADLRCVLLFFPDADAATQVISSLLTFAIGYFGRPVAGILFSHFGDRIGCKPMLVATLLLMGASTLAIGFLPTHAEIGIWAAVLLACCRVLQGMGAGAEYVGSLVMMAETGDRRRLGLRVALPGMGVFAGIVIATGVFALITLLPDEALLSWGWRVPFLLSVVTVAVGLWIRRGIDETEDFREVRAEGRIARYRLTASAFSGRAGARTHRRAHRGPTPAFAAWLVLENGGAPWPVSVLFIIAAAVAAGTFLLAWRRLARVESD